MTAYCAVCCSTCCPKIHNKSDQSNRVWV